MAFGWLWRSTRTQLLILILVGGSAAQQYEKDQQQNDKDQFRGDFATISEVPFLDETYENITNSHRQDLCGQYELYRTGDLELKDALRGLELKSVFIVDQYFHYSEEVGIDPKDPGLLALLMDMIAEKAGFTWRSSFAVMDRPYIYNMSWTQELWWSVNAYDISVNYWDQSLLRTGMGISFTEPWYDGSIIMVDKLEEDEMFSNEWDLLNWTRPFDGSVWILIVITILISGLVYQLMEYIQGEQQDRPFSQWFMDNQYLSLLNATTNFEYAPYTGPGRIFAFSMAFWALVLMATYTANLANLFVADNRPRPVVSSIEEAAAKKIPICTYQGTNSDDILKRWYPSAERRPKNSEIQMFQDLQSGECVLATVAIDGWNSIQTQKAYNPKCNLKRVARTIAEIKSSFAIKTDVGYKCTSLVRDVFDFHLRKLIDEGELRNLWAIHRSKLRDIDCNADIPEAVGYGKGHANYDSQSGGRRNRNLRSKNQNTGGRKLQLVASQEGGGVPPPPEESSLSLHEMAGAFVFHYGLMLVAIVASLISPYWTKLTISWGWEQPEQFVVRSHGPTVGPPPRAADAESCSPNPTTIIQAYGSPIPNKRMSRLSINTYVNPSKGYNQVDTVARSRGDEFRDETAPSRNGLAMEMAKVNKSQSGNCEEETVIDAASLARLQHYIDVKLQKANQHLEERFDRYEDKLNHHMGMMIAMLENMRKQEEERYKDLQVMLTNDKKKEMQQPQQGDQRSAVGNPTQHTTDHGHQTGRKDFGHYLRKKTEKRDFGQYVRHNSQHHFLG